MHLSSSNRNLVVKEHQNTLDCYEKAQQCLIEKNFKLSAEYCHKILALEPDNLDFLTLQVQIELGNNEVDSAINLLSDILKENPHEINLHFTLANIFIEMQNKTKAIEVYKRAISIITSINVDQPILEFLKALVNFICITDRNIWKEIHPCFKEMGKLLESTNLFEKKKIEVEMYLSVMSKKIKSKSSIIYSIMELYGFNIESKNSWNELLIDVFVLPQMKQLLAEKNYNAALYFEGILYVNYVKQLETEVHFHKSFNKWKDMMILAGYQADEKFPMLNGKTNKIGKIEVGYFIHTESRLAHTQLMLSFFEGLRQSKNSSIEPIVYSFSGRDTCFRIKLKKLRIPLISLDDLEPQISSSSFTKLLFIRAHIQKAMISALVWVSVVQIMSFAFSLRLAKVQIWWAMKYHHYDHPEIDGYITGGTLSKNKIINNRTWRTSPTAFSNLFDARLKKKAGKIIKEYPNDSIILGSLGREEKLNSIPFLNAIAKILKEKQNAIFLWTGKKKLDSIQAYFESKALENRCYYIGWVDTKTYSQVIDIFMDSFPFPCGLTIFEAMAAGKPMVLFDSKESRQTGVNGIISPILNREEGTNKDQKKMSSIFSSYSFKNLYFCATTIDEYVDISLDLISKKKLRIESGNANKEFIKIFMSNKMKMANQYEKHILEVIKENTLREVEGNYDRK